MSTLFMPTIPDTLPMPGLLHFRVMVHVYKQRPVLQGIVKDIFCRAMSVINTLEFQKELAQRLNSLASGQGVAQPSNSGMFNYQRYRPAINFPPPIGGSPASVQPASAGGMGGTPASVQPASAGGMGRSVPVDLVEQEKAERRKHALDALNMKLTGDQVKQYVDAMMQPVAPAPPAPPKVDTIDFEKLDKDEKHAYLKAMSTAVEMGFENAQEFACDHIIERRKEASVDKTGNDKKRAATSTEADDATHKKKSKTERRQFKRLAAMLEDGSFKNDADWKHNCQQIVPETVTKHTAVIAARYAKDILSAHAETWGYPAFAMLTYGTHVLTPWTLPDKAAKKAYKTFLSEHGLPVDYDGKSA